MGVSCCSQVVKSKSIPVKLMNEVSKGICKIIIKETNENATGFFLDIFPSFKCLLTNYHVISQDKVDSNCIIQIENDSGQKIEIKLEKEKRYIQCFDKPIDITLIEIKNSDGIDKYFNFLDYDKNNNNGNQFYKNKNVFTLQHRLGYKLQFASGKIKKISGNEFVHNIDTDVGSSGSPIILLSDEKPTVIGIHKAGNLENLENYGTFIEVIIRTINQKITNNEIIVEEETPSIIVAILIVTSDDINKDILIINSHENSERNSLLNKINIPDNIDHQRFNNEKEIKQCEIKIDGEKIDFTYTLKFQQSGRHIITYTFKKKLTKCNRLFFSCSNLFAIDLSKFNSEDITDMTSMFHQCKNLNDVNLTNLNTKKLTNMCGMFAFCYSIKNLDLSYFDTFNVTDMRSLFFFCFALNNIKFSPNFNTSNVTDMSMMFGGCKSLNNLDVSGFNTENVENMSLMFSICSSLTSLDLSNFDTQNVIDMSLMFECCSSLINLNLSNFNAQYTININKMFKGCNSLTRENLISSDEKILKEFDNKI